LRGIEFPVASDDDKSMNRYFEELLHSAFHGQHSAAAPELARRLLCRRLPLPSDSDVTELYHEALAEACVAIKNEVADAQAEEDDLNLAFRRKVEALEFLLQFRPYSPRRAHRRPDHYWAAYHDWADAARTAITGFPRSLVPDSIRRDIAFYSGWSASVRLEPGFGWTAEKLPFSALWLIKAEGALMTRFGWRRLSPAGVSAYALPGRVLLVQYRDTARLSGEILRGALYVRGAEDVRLLGAEEAEEELALLRREARSLPVEEAPAAPAPPRPTFTATE
jgi:hypothetical protein